jgi:hypothetical protein
MNEHDKATNQTPTPWLHRLFEHMADVYGLILVSSELDEIYRICQQASDPAPSKPKRYQTERSRCPHCGSIVEPVPVPYSHGIYAAAEIVAPCCQQAVEVRIVEVPE